MRDRIIGSTRPSGGWYLGSSPSPAALTFLNNPELVEGEFSNDNAHRITRLEPCMNNTEKARSKYRWATRNNLKKEDLGKFRI